MVAVMVRRQTLMWVLVVCCAAGFIVAVALLEGAARGLVAMVSGVVGLLAGVWGLDDKETRELERHVESGDRWFGQGGGL
jgi:hypothetical protein